MAIKIDIKNEETIYINPETGQRMSYEEFKKRYSKGVRGVMGKIGRNQTKKT